MVGKTLDFIRSQNLAVELSTAGWRKPISELYPADRIIELAIERGIPFTTASDAHSHAQLGDNFIAINADVTNLADLERVFAATAEKFGKIDVIVANAGGGAVGTVATTSETDFDQAIGSFRNVLGFDVTQRSFLVPAGATV